MFNNKMKKKISHKNIKEDLLKNSSKILKKKEKTFFYKPSISGYSLINQNERAKKLLNKEKPKREKKLSNLTNYGQIRLEKIKLKKTNKSNISVANTYKNNLFNAEMSNKKNFKIQNYYTNSKNKNIICNKNKKFNSISITKNLFILDNDKNNNKNGTKINNKNNNNPFSEKIKTNKIIFKNILKNKIHKKIISKFDLEKSNNNYIDNHNITYNRNNNNNNYNKLNTENDLSKILKITEKIESLYKKEKNNNCISNQVKINVNMSNSLKLTNISSHASNLNSKKKSAHLLNKNFEDIKKFKKKFLLRLKIDSKETETQEYESQFLNYDLGLSDKITSSKNNYKEENIFFCSKEKNVNEYEKPVEEIEKLANEIYNSQYKLKKKSYIFALKQNFDINNNTEELKEGEEIKPILSLIVNKKNK